jgi:hypothetical protein
VYILGSAMAFCIESIDVLVGHGSCLKSWSMIQK